MYGDSYASPAELADRLGDSVDEALLVRLLEAASRAIELFTGRQFNRDGSASSSSSSSSSSSAEAMPRRFRAVDPERLPVDDFYTLDDLEVETAGVVWDPTNLDARPWNGTYGGMLGWPYFDLFAVGRSWPYSRRATIMVTAHWGWEAVPEAIAQATLDVAQIMADTNLFSGSRVSESVGSTYAITYMASVFGTDWTDRPEFLKARPYRRVRFGVA